MLVVQAPTADTLQKQVLVLPDGSQATIILCYVPMQYGWFLQQLTYGAFELFNLRITTCPNVLQQFKNLLPFGLQCVTQDGGEPKLQQDFSSGYASLFLLSAEEVVQLTELYNE